MRWLLLCLLLVVVIYSSSLGAPEQRTESPMEVVKTTLSEVLSVLGNTSMKPPDKRRKIEEIVASRFDYREMSKRTLASHWNQLTEREQSEFVQLFQSFLSDRYAGRIQDYSGEKVEYLSERLEGPYAEIRTKMVSSKTDFPLDYRMINKDGRWYAYDIIADGVSLVKNYRSQFEKIMRTESYSELVKRLKDRTIPEDRHTVH